MHYLIRWVCFLILYLIIYPPLVLMSLVEGLVDDVREMWEELTKNIKSDFKLCLRGEPFL